LKGPFRLEYGSLFSYCPRSTSQAGRFSRGLMYVIKNELPVETRLLPPELAAVVTLRYVLPSQLIATLVSRNLQSLPFGEFFGKDVTLVPVPRASLLQRDALWPSLNIARALEKEGLGKCEPLLKRIGAIRRSSLAPAEKRPTPLEHYESMLVEKTLVAPASIVLVDDIVTRGHTFLGATWRLHEAFPETKIVAFAAMRTISKEKEFKDWMNPRRGFIQYRPEKGDALRRP